MKFPSRELVGQKKEIFFSRSVCHSFCALPFVCYRGDRWPMATNLTPTRSLAPPENITLCPRSPVLSAPTILNLPVEKIPPPLNLDVYMSPSFARAFSLFCSSEHLLGSFLARLDRKELCHFLNLTNFFDCSSHVITSLRGQTLRKGSAMFVSLHLQHLTHGYLHSCIGTFLSLSQAQIFPPNVNPKRVLQSPKTIPKTFFFLIDIIASSLTELPNNVLLLLFGWKSKRPLEVFFENILFPALDDPETVLGFPLSVSMKVLTKALSSLLLGCRRIGAVDLDAVSGIPNAEAMVDVIRSQKLQRKLQELGEAIERPSIDQDLPDSYVSFLELWEDNHHPCELDGPLACDVNVLIPISLSLSVFQQLLRDRKGDVTKRIHSRAARGKVPMGEVDSAQKVMEALSSC